MVARSGCLLIFRSAAIEFQSAKQSADLAMPILAARGVFSNEWNRDAERPGNEFAKTAGRSKDGRQYQFDRPH